jgi:hypothetical protein
MYGDDVVSFCVNEFSSTGFNLQRSAWTDKNLNEQTKIQYFIINCIIKLSLLAVVAFYCISQLKLATVKPNQYNF